MSKVLASPLMRSLLISLKLFYVLPTGAKTDIAIVNAFNTVGSRKFVIHIAADFHAQYISDNKSDSIWYDGNDLRIRLLFHEITNAASFINALQDLQIRAGLEEADSIVKHVSAIETVRCDVRVVRMVFRSDYSSADTGSPSVSSRSREEYVDNNISPSSDVATFQSIEKPMALRGSFCQKCHIKDKALCLPDERNDANNFLGLTPTSHLQFDGLASGVPKIRLKVMSVDTKSQKMWSTERTVFQLRFRVDILVEFVDDDALQGGGMIFKDGSTRLPGLKVQTFVHVLDTDAFCRYMEWKYNRTTEAGFS